MKSSGNTCFSLIFKTWESGRKWFWSWKMSKIVIEGSLKSLSFILYKMSKICQLFVHRIGAALSSSRSRLVQSCTYQYVIFSIFVLSVLVCFLSHMAVCRLCTVLAKEGHKILLDHAVYLCCIIHFELNQYSANIVLNSKNITATSLLLTYCFNGDKKSELMLIRRATASV